MKKIYRGFEILIEKDYFIIKRVLDGWILNDGTLYSDISCLMDLVDEFWEDPNDFEPPYTDEKEDDNDSLFYDD